MNAFSLIELVVIISIMSVIFGVTIPNLNRFLSALHINLAANDVCSTLYMAQKKARAENSQCAVKFDSVDKFYTISGKEIKFAPSGNTAFSGNGTITIKNIYNKTKKIIVSTAGRIRIE